MHPQQDSSFSTPIRIDPYVGFFNHEYGIALLFAAEHLLDGTVREMQSAAAQRTVSCHESHT